MFALLILFLVACAAFLAVKLLTGVFALAALAFIIVVVLGLTSGINFGRRPPA